MKANCKKCGKVDLNTLYYTQEIRKKYFKKLRIMRIDLICPNCNAIISSNEYAIKKKRLYTIFDGRLYMSFDSEDKVKEWAENVLNVRRD